jgi:type I restriction enzyme S subunit
LVLSRGVKRGATVHSLASGFLEKLPIPLPPLPEQRWIVDLLSRAAGIRRLREQALAKAREAIPALFLSMFGDPATNPKGWPVVTLGDVIRSGPQNGLYRPASDYGDGVRILRIDSFDDGTIADVASLKRLRIGAKMVARYGLASGDIVINRVNSPPQLGKSALVPDLDEPVVFESNMMRFRLDEGRLRPDAAIVMLQLSSVRRQLTRNAKHAINQSSINQGDVKAVRFPLPAMPLQRTFASRLADLRAILAQQERSLAAARDLERTLMGRLLG